ncbi:hypothetical protein LUZ60_012785 [Juncus effusus]|nr:hypothetical protein LUZ60_012785 [Juncus effusus]
MRGFAIFLLFLILIHKESMVNLAYGRSEEEEFFDKCPPSQCGSGGPVIRFPYRLSSQPSHCGLQGMELTCSGNNTILNHPTAGMCKVKTIDYIQGLITIQLKRTVSLCLIQNLTSLNLTTPLYTPFSTTTMYLVQCSKTQVNQLDQFSPFFWFSTGPILCLSNSNQQAYLFERSGAIFDLPSFCTVLLNNVSIPNVSDNFSFYDNLEYLRYGMHTHLNVTLMWSGGEGCQACEVAGKQCSGTKSFCVHKRTNPKVIGAASAIAFVVLVVVIYFISRNFIMDDDAKHEELLAKYNKKLTRYSFSEIKKITKHFKDKLGQGGFGSVYKGELPDGILVAIKIIERSNTDSKDFINEVSTIGTIHHFNVVRLLGFCSEGNRRALVYEFMRSGSLDKYICTKSESFNVETLLKIVKGIASGIKYLHEGCNLRILHFDIKPHNILLDHNLNPKISDFGLAKLSLKDRTDVTITAAKGTIGYMAPEVYSRNFGNVSNKSDVYSFGMLILKMVVGDKHLEPDLATGQSEVYYPELIYEKLVKKEELESVIEVATNDDVITKKLLIVAFWCIQWNPAARPNISRVVQMLDSELESLEISPKPFL